MLKWGKEDKVIISTDGKDLFPKYTNRGGNLFEKINTAITVSQTGEVSTKENRHILQENHSLFGDYLK